ncbi:MAG: alpha-amylase family glycosyl hydrolase [Bdellovibrionota bacterium]
MTNTSLYQINTRAFCHKHNKTLLEIPMSYFENLKDLGIEYIWLMGLWEPLLQTYIDKYCKTDGLLKEYKSALFDVESKDIIGSPYAISNYVLNKSLGDREDLKILKQKLNDIGLKLIVDFVPNHFGASTPLLKTHEEVFLQCRKEDFDRDGITFFEPDNNKGKYFAHGKDPNYVAWQDTVQVNYFNDNARKFMKDILKGLCLVADGVRCDMAMLAVNKVFKKTWGEVLKAQNIKTLSGEFWQEAIAEVKKESPSFIFIAEVYWDMEWEMQQLGFDYTYDKRLLDRITHSNANDIRDHLKAQISYQKKLVRFIENHDEKRSIASLGKEKAKMGAIIISTILGMRFYYDGQFEGAPIRLPVQLRREPIFNEDADIKSFYLKLLKIVNNDVFKKGTWRLLDVEKGMDDLSQNNILAWSLEYLEYSKEINKENHKENHKEYNKEDNKEKRIVVVNFSEYESSAHIKFNFDRFNFERDKNYVLEDLLNDVKYERTGSELADFGLFVKLSKYSAHIFKF